MQGDGVWTSVRELPVAMEYLGGVSLNNHILMTGKTRLPASRSSSVGPEGRFSFFHPKVKVKKTISLTSFVFWGLVGLKVLINFKSFQGLLTNVVFYPHPPPPTLMLPGGVAKK